MIEISSREKAGGKIMGDDDRVSYDNFCYVFGTFLCIGRQIRWQIEELLMVWETFYIVFTRVVVIQFSPRSSNSIGFWVFCSEESCKSTNQDITWRINDNKLETNDSHKVFENNTEWRKIISSS